jgi:hypothetical protein
MDACAPCRLVRIAAHPIRRVGYTHVDPSLSCSMEERTLVRRYDGTIVVSNCDGVLPNHDSQAVDDGGWSCLLLWSRALDS